MRVTHVITRLVVGGAQENTLATVRGLRARTGLDVRLLSARPPARKARWKKRREKYFRTRPINSRSFPNSSAPSIP